MDEPAATLVVELISRKTQLAQCRMLLQVLVPEVHQQLHRDRWYSAAKTMVQASLRRLRSDILKRQVREFLCIWVLVPGHDQRSDVMHIDVIRHMVSLQLWLACAALRKMHPCIWPSASEHLAPWWASWY